MASQPAELQEDRGPWRRSSGLPEVRAAHWEDLGGALRLGWADFRAAPALGLAVGALYAAGGWLLLWVLELKEIRGLSFPVVAGFALIGPFVAVILYEVMAFVVPGLTPKERRILFFGMFGAVFFLLSGMAFAYFIILPVSLDFLLGLASDQTENELSRRFSICPEVLP